jgi:hypothetical protein
MSNRSAPDVAGPAPVVRTVLRRPSARRVSDVRVLRELPDDERRMWRRAGVIRIIGELYDDAWRS